MYKTNAATALCAPGTSEPSNASIGGTAIIM